MKTGIANLPLHWGASPPWLFERMSCLGREIIRVMVEEYGSQEVLRRLSDPYWFQAFGSLLGFDWHSSGLTTTLMAALKEGLKGLEKSLGIFIVGGKGKTSRKAPQEIEEWADKLSFSDNQANNLVYASRMSAKIDNTALQDGFQLYHHNLIFTSTGAWTVIQQGMNPKIHLARRYHWFSPKINPTPLTQSIKSHKKEFKLREKESRYEDDGASKRCGVKNMVEEPHSGIISQQKVAHVLDLTARKSRNTREVATELVRNGLKSLLKDLKKISYLEPKTLNLPSRHFITRFDFDQKRMEKILSFAHDQMPKNFEDLLGIKGVGPKTIRALALISELIYGTKPSFKDPARYSWAHGGKDGTPYPVSRDQYDQSIEILQNVVRKSRIESREKNNILRQLTQKSYEFQG